MNRLVVVSNRVPLPSAGPQVGGLAVALTGLMDHRGGLWFGWSGDIAETAPTAKPHIERAGMVDYVTTDLTAEEHQRYYNNFSNAVLWPLLHTLPELVRFDRADAISYHAVNERIAGTLASLLRPTDLVWVHDYHLMPLPALLRARGLRNPIGFFLHIPFAAPDVLGVVPEMASLVSGLLGADLIGFQTANDLANFAEAAQSLSGAMRLSTNVLQVAGRRVRLGVFPVEIDAAAFAHTAEDMVAQPTVARLRESLQGAALIFGVDRLDPTKGLLQRITGYRRLIETRTEWRRRAVFLQIAAVSRKDVDSYQSLHEQLDHAAGTLNADLGEADWQPLRLINRGCARGEAAGFMRAARVGLVTPVRDGMNLVAKEYVAAQDPADPGVLVLSKFAGAANQLETALLVNPSDPDDIAEALQKALTMGIEERLARWQAQYAAISDRSPLGWGRSFTAALLRTAAAGSAVAANLHTPDLRTPDLRTASGPYTTQLPVMTDRAAVPIIGAALSRPRGEWAKDRTSDRVGERAGDRAGERASLAGRHLN